jgi:stress response protein YsnF
MTGAPLREGTTEVEERDEQAVVSKQARVKEELVVHQDVEQRTEMNSDAVR